jgi:anti-anti-sigma regulatory factor
VLRLEGAWVHANLHPLRGLLQSQAAKNRPLAIDLGGVTYLDGAAIGLLTLLYGWHQKTGLHWSVMCVSAQARRLLKLACADYLVAAL